MKTTKKETKYFKISFDTNVEKFARHATFYTTSNYYDAKEIEVQVKDNIYNLNLPRIARVENISVTEITAIESSKFNTIESAYQTLKRAANNMRWNMEKEKLKRSGVKHIKLALFFKKMDALVDSCSELED